LSTSNTQLLDLEGKLLFPKDSLFYLLYQLF
jgi:hypothetical protein